MTVPKKDDKELFEGFTVAPRMLKVPTAVGDWRQLTRGRGGAQTVLGKNHPEFSR